MGTAENVARFFFLEGGVAQKVQGTAGLVAVRVRVPGATWVVVLAPGAAGILPVARFREAWPGGGEAPAPALLSLRRRLEGARVRGLDGQGVLTLAAGDAILRLALSRGGLPELTAGEGPTGEGPTGEGPTGEGPTGEGPAGGATNELSRAEWQRRGDELLASTAERSLEHHRGSLERALTRARAKVRRRCEAMRGDLARMEEAVTRAQEATAFVASARDAPRGARRLVVTDWSTGEAVERELPLDPARGAREQLDAIFRRARRLKQARPRVEERLEAAQRLTDALAGLEREARGAETAAALHQLAASARRLAPQDFTLATAAGRPAGGAAREASRAEARRPFRTFTARDGAPLYVGRGAADNDALTLHVARPGDLWVHAKGRTGAHVVVPLTKGKSCPPERLVDAAHLAAHFGGARDEAAVEVQYTPRRYVRKPKGSAPGFVVVEREKVLLLRVEPARLDELLASEQRGP